LLFTKKAIDQSATDDEISKILEVKHDVLDAMGVYQHHDGISGTAKQHVADNYVYHLSKALHSSNKEYKKLLADEMLKNTGI